MLGNDLRNGEVIEIRVEGQGLGQEFLSVPQPGLWGRCYPSLTPPCWGWDGAAAGPSDVSGLAAPSVHPRRGFSVTAWPMKTSGPLVQRSTTFLKQPGEEREEIAAGSSLSAWEVGARGRRGEICV